jgi:hypothetical protein
MATQRATIKSLAEILFRHPSLRGRQAALRIEEDAVDLLIDETNLPQRSLRDILHEMEWVIRASM